MKKIRRAPGLGLYVVANPREGWCGHVHRKLSSAITCMEKQRKALEKHRCACHWDIWLTPCKTREDAEVWVEGFIFAKKVRPGLLVIQEQDDWYLYELDNTNNN